MHPSGEFGPGATHRIQWAINRHNVLFTKATLMPMPPELQRRVAHIDVISGMTFPSSVRCWQSPSETAFRWLTVDLQTQPMLIGERDGLLIDASSEANISAPDGGIVHINGNLNADLETGGHHEVIIRGDISERSTIRASGFFHVYVGGSVFGSIVAEDSSNIWVDGNFAGSLTTGNPATYLHIAGDLSGSISPTNRAALLWLSVGGFADDTLVTSISMMGYTQFNATIGSSTVPPGIYPSGPGRRETESGGNSFRRWCVLSQGESRGNMC